MPATRDPLWPGNRPDGFCLLALFMLPFTVPLALTRRGCRSAWSRLRGRR